MTGWRLPSGGLIDRGKPVKFQWNRKNFTGFSGDTLASALLANGVQIVGRSFKYHRPRGLLAAGIEEPNAIVQLEAGAETLANHKATQVELYEGLRAKPVNSWPSVDFDLMAANSLIKRFIPAAFYYKTFTRPHWRWFEPAIRRAAGLGRAPSMPDPDSYEHRFAATGTLVVGAGASGLAAALAAAERGEEVILVEMDAVLGGGLLAQTDPIDGQPPEIWRAEIIARLEALPHVTLMPRCMAFGYYDHNLIGLCENLTGHLPPGQRKGPRERLWKLRANRVLLATGAFEKPATFAGNDLPGVMLASAAQTYALRYGVAPGRSIIVATNNNSAYTTAFVLHDLGISISAIADTRTDPGRIAQQAEERGIAVLTGAAPLQARGRSSIRSVEIGRWSDGARLASLPCDALLMAGGWSPAVHLHSQSGGSLRFDDALLTFLPDALAQAAQPIGAAAGIFDPDTALHQARALAVGEEVTIPRPVPVGPAQHFSDGDARAHCAWVDFQNDVTAGDVQLAARENYRSVEHLKRYTTLGMASDQGKTSNITGIQLLSGLIGKHPQDIGTTKFRPPFDPVSIGAFAGIRTGQNLQPLAQCASHEPALALGAAMEPYGSWLRASYFPTGAEDEQAAIAREVLCVRKSVGLFDASPLGKIEVNGPDSAIFLDRLYANRVGNLKIGRCRYGLMLTEHGIVFDDGICARLGENRFLVGTTSGHAAAIADTMEEWLQCEWPDLRVVVENVTTAWAVINLAGPLARDVLSRIGTDIDLSPATFPHMACRECTIGGVEARIQRVSFSGELSYEVSVPWGYGRALWEAAMQAGDDYGIAPFGVESLMALRVEKGFLHVGSDTDGTTMPQDIGFGAAVANKASDFIGRRSTLRPEGLRENRRQLVGLEVTDNGPILDVGAHVLPTKTRDPGASQGWVTSSILSPTLRRPLALALIESGEKRLGEEVHIWSLNTWRKARIAKPAFYDPQGDRLHG